MNSDVMNKGIGELFLLFIEAEMRIEALRKELNSQADFDPLILFKRIDYMHKKRIEQDNFVKFLKLHRIEGNINEINFVIMTYDSDSSKAMNYNQFLNMVLSQGFYSTKKSQNGYQHYMTQGTEVLFVSLLQSELSLAKDVLALLPFIIKQEGFTIEGVIKELKGNAYLTEENLEELTQLKRDKDKVKGLMRRLDLTKNGKITIEELNKIFYYPHEQPPSMLYHKRRTLSMEPSSSRNVNQQNVNGNQTTVQYKRNNNDELNKAYYSTDADNNIKHNANSSNQEPKRQSYSICQTESNANNLRRMTTENTRPEIHQYNYQNNLQMSNSNNQPIGLQSNTYYYQPTQAEPNHNNTNNRSRNYANRNQQINTHTQTQPRNQRRNLRITTDAYNEHPTLFDTNYITTTIPHSRLGGLFNTINSSISVNDNTNTNNQRHQQQQQPQYQATSNIRTNNGQYNSNVFSPIRVSDTLHIRLSPERHNGDSNRNQTHQLIAQQLQDQEGRENKSLPEEEEAEDTLITIWKQIIEIEAIIEREKIKLSNQKDFNIEDAFSIFETKANQAQLSLSDMKLGYASFNLFPTVKDVTLLFKKYDVDKKGCLNYGDFFDMLTPFNKPIRDEMERRQPSKYRPSFNKTNVFNGITKDLIKGLLSILINSESHLSNLRKAINDKEGHMASSIQKLYSRIDLQGRGYITPKDIKHYMRDTDMSFNQNALDLMYIRFDKDRDGIIHYEEFSNEFSWVI